MKTKIPMKRKVLLQEPLEDRLLLAVDAFGLSADIAHSLDDHDSSCVSHFSCCEATQIDDTALVYGKYFADENYTPVRPMVFDDWVAYDTFTTWKATVAPEIYQAMRDFFSQGNLNDHDNITPETLQQAFEDILIPRAHGKIMPMVFGKLPVDFDEGGLIQVMCGGSGDDPNSGGGCNEKPHFSGGSDQDTPPIIEVFLDAGNSIDSASIPLSEYFCSCDCGNGLSYSVTSYDSGIVNSPSISSTVLTVKPTGTSGVGTVTVTGTNAHGSANLTITVYSISVIGFQIEERAWGEGMGDEGWHVVEDRDKTVVPVSGGGTEEAGLWNLLWQENEYRWKPIISPAVGAGLVPENIRSVNFSVSGGSGFASGSYGPPCFESGGGDHHGEILNPAKSYWPYAEGIPGLGEHRIACNISVGTATLDAHVYTNTQGQGITMSITPSPTKQQPRIGVTAIASVEWGPVDSCTNAIQLGPNPPYNGGGLRCFPERSDPDPESDNHNEILTLVTLAAPIPGGMTGTVHIDWFDPDNPRGSTITPSHNGPGLRDNRGDFAIDNTTLTFASGTQQQWATCTISPAHAGDNYIVAVHPNEGIVQLAEINPLNNTIAIAYENENNGSGGNGSGGTSYHNLTKSDMLTVWRTLWVELDQMAAPDVVANPQYVGMTQPPKPDISLLQTAMLAACVDVKELPVGLNTNSTAVFASVIGETTTPGFQDISESCRDVTLDLVTESFWCVHGIGAYESDGGYTGFASGDLDGGSFYVFRETIAMAVASNPFLVGGLGGQWARTTYHEVMHYFGFNDVYADDILEQLALASGKSLDYLINLLESHDGRIYEFFLNHFPNYMDLLEYPTGGDPTQGIMDYCTLDSGTWEDIKLKPHQIVQIQQLTKPRPYSSPS